MTLKHFVRRTFILAAALIGAISCHTNGISEKKCIIEGNLSGVEGNGWIYLEDAWNGFEIIDSVRCYNGVFTMKIDEVEFETFATMTYITDDEEEDYEVRRFLLEPGTILIEGDLEEDRFSGAEGTAMNDLFNNSRNEFSEFYRNLTRDAAKIKADSLTQEIFTKDITPAFRLYFINQKMMEYPSALLLNELEKLPEPYIGLNIAQQYKAVLSERAKTEPQVDGSDMIPYYIDFTINDLNGTVINLKDIVENRANRYVLVDFWATWCGPCREEIPHLIDAYSRFKDRGLEIVGLAVDDNAERCNRYISENDMRWINACDDKEHGISSHYGIWGIPDNVLIDCKTGIIIRRDLRGEHLNEELTKLMK